jgi:hypothetical protein
VTTALADVDETHPAERPDHIGAGHPRQRRIHTAISIGTMTGGPEIPTSG